VPSGSTGFTGSERIQKLNEIIDCQDTFYEFKFSRVYTVSNLIDEYKKGGRGRFIGIKEIDDSACESTVNKFPTNDGFKNFNILFFLFSILMQLLQVLSVPLLIVIHVLAFVWNTLVRFKDIFNVLMGLLTGYFLFTAIRNFVLGGKEQTLAANYTAAAITAAAFVVTAALAPVFTLAAVAAQTAAGTFFLSATKNLITAFALSGVLILFNLAFRLFKGQPVKGFNLPVILYPDCTACDCGTTVAGVENQSSLLSTLLTQFSNPGLYYNNLETSVKNFISTLPSTNQPTQDDVPIISYSFSTTIGGNNDNENNNQKYKTMKADVASLTNGKEFYTYSNYIPFGERINNFNLRQKYFNGINRISVSFDSNAVKHYDNTMVLIYDVPLDAGSLLTFVNPLATRDVNATYTGNTGPFVRGISGTPLNPGVSTYNVEYCDPNNQLDNLTVSYLLSTGSTLNNYKFF
jgi:hypothetical protein